VAIFIVVLSLVVFAIVSVSPGAPSDPEKIEGATVGIFGIQFGCVGAAFTAMNYARQARLINDGNSRRNSHDDTNTFALTSPTSLSDIKV
jgi:hypothetical protein